MRKPFHTTLEADLVREAKIQCLLEDVALNAVIEQLLREWLVAKRAPPAVGEQSENNPPDR